MFIIDYIQISLKKSKNLMHLKDKISKNVVYSMNIHQVCGKNTKKHALKETILQNINQT